MLTAAFVRARPCYRHWVTAEERLTYVYDQQTPVAKASPSSGDNMQALRGSPLILAVRLPRRLCRGRSIVRGIAAPAPTTRVRYIKRPHESELFIYTVPPPQEKDRVTNVDVDEVPMPLSDLRT